MTQAEMVTDFAAYKYAPVPDKPGYLHHVGMAKLTDLVKALNAHCGHLADEYNFSLASEFRYAGDRRRDDKHIDATIPGDLWHLIAFCVEGGSEGYYVHVGALLRTDKVVNRNYVDIAFAKTYSTESAYQLAREAQRFLTATEWN